MGCSFAANVLGLISDDGMSDFVFIAASSGPLYCTLSKTFSHFWPYSCLCGSLLDSLLVMLKNWSDCSEESDLPGDVVADLP